MARLGSNKAKTTKEKMQELKSLLNGMTLDMMLAQQVAEETSHVVVYGNADNTYDVNGRKMNEEEYLEWRRSVKEGHGPSHVIFFLPQKGNDPLLQHEEILLIKQPGALPIVWEEKRDYDLSKDEELSKPLVNVPAPIPDSKPVFKKDKAIKRPIKRPRTKLRPEMKRKIPRRDPHAPMLKRGSDREYAGLITGEQHESFNTWMNEKLTQL